MTMTVLTTCPFCGKFSFIDVDADAYEAWQCGDLLIQEAFPTLSADDREQLKTGICPACWDSMFGEEEEEEETSPHDEPEEFDYDFADTYCEIGFNPYLGAYDWDE